MHSILPAEEYLSLVSYVAYSCHLDPLPSFDFDDMVAVGNLAVVEATKTFDPNREASFRTYVFPRIKWAIYTAYRKQFPIAHEAYAKDPSRKITLTDLDAPVRYGNGEGDMVLSDTLPENVAPDIAGQLDIERAMRVLTPREAQIVYGYFWEGHSATDISRALGVTNTGVSRSLRTALSKLRCALGE